MNSSLIVSEPLYPGRYTPNFVFVADQMQQRILCSNIANPQTLLQQDNLEIDHYQVYLNSPMASEVSFRNIKEDLMDTILKAPNGQKGQLFRFRDDMGFWRFGYLEPVVLHGGKSAENTYFCGVISLLQNPASHGDLDQPMLSRLVWVTDSDLKLTQVGSECRTLGFDVATLLAGGELRFLTEETASFLQSVCEDLFQSEHPETRVIRQAVRALDGSAVSATIQFSILYNESGNIVGTLGIADFYPSRELLDSERQLFSAMFESISEGIFITDRNGFILRANPAFYQVTGYQPSQILGIHCSYLWKNLYGPEYFRKIRHCMQRDLSWKEECRYIRSDGNVRPAILSFSQTRNARNEVQNYVGMLMDISDKKRDEQRIYRLAHYDSLTGVANRLLFRERLKDAVDSASPASSLAVLFLDLDRFKPVNDSLGHGAGDQLLKGVARRLLYCLGEGDTVARMGGDEFAILVRNVSDLQQEEVAIKTASKVLAQFFSPFLIDGREVYTSASIGISLYPHHGHDSEVLLRSADTAMYDAKRSGKNNYKFYDEQMNKRAMDRLIMENAMRKALIKEDFDLYFQPQYSVNDGTMTGVEVLLRWDHPVFGTVRPLEFIDLAEKTDLIIPLGEWVFHKTCEKLAKWHSRGVSVGRVAVNVSANQFKRDDFADWVLFHVQRYGINPNLLEIEITESALMEDVDHSLHMLNTLRQANIRIAVDDFGTGYSSLNYLRRFPISTLKIDRVFVEDIVDDPSTLELAQTVIAIAKSLKLGVIAEGVENLEQYRLLSEQGCDEVQGYYLCKALSESSLLNKLTSEMTSDAIPD